MPCLKNYQVHLGVEEIHIVWDAIKWEREQGRIEEEEKKKERKKNGENSLFISLQEGSLFGAAYYLKEIVTKGVISSLFELTYDEASAKKDLWWQVRALQELCWQTELKELLLQNKEKINASNRLRLKQELALAMGDDEQYYKLM